MTLKTKGIFSGIFCLLVGGLIFYYEGYKDNSFIKFLSIGLVYLGWIIFLGSLFGAILLTDKKIRFANHKLLWFKDKTIIVSTHNLNLLALFDRVCVFEGGRIVASGTFRELLSGCFAFQILWQNYVKHQEKTTTVGE